MPIMAGYTTRVLSRKKVAGVINAAALSSRVRQLWFSRYLSVTYHLQRRGTHRAG